MVRAAPRGGSESRPGSEHHLWERFPPPFVSIYEKNRSVQNGPSRLCSGIEAAHLALCIDSDAPSGPSPRLTKADPPAGDLFLGVFWFVDNKFWLLLTICGCVGWGDRQRAVLRVALEPSRVGAEEECACHCDPEGKLMMRKKKKKRRGLRRRWDKR